MLLRQDALPVAREALFLEPGWLLEESEHQGLALATFTKRT